MNRRKFFSHSALAAGSVAAFPHIARPVGLADPAPGQKPGRIIHLVADGMNVSTLTAGDYLSHHLRKRGLTWTSLLTRPGVAQGLMNMRSLNSVVTDSSAASSSWGSGSRVANGALNQLPSGKSLTPLYSLFSQKGWKRGLVTTTEITHATPAGFAAVADSRDNGTSIAAQYLERGVDVLLGGGTKFFEAAKRKDKRDLKAEYAAAEYCVLETATDLAHASLDQRWLGIFSESHLPYMIDWQVDPKLRQRVPELAAMTRRALEWLGGHEHFILQVEGGRVDHGAHNCDAPAALRELIAFDEALDAVLEFQSRRPDTLVVVTSDHGTGNLGLNGSGSNYGQTASMFHRIADVKASFGEILRRLRQRVSAVSDTTSASKVPEINDIQEVIAETTGYKVSERRAGWFQAFLAKRGTCLYEALNSETAQLGQLLANHIAVGWTTSAHTADFVPITALGPGAERFAGFVQNTDVFRCYTVLAGIDFQNPAEPLISAAGEQVLGVENVAEYALV